MARNKNRTNNKSGAPAIPNKPVKQLGVLKNLFSKAGIELEPEVENKLNPEQALLLEKLVETLNKSIEQNEQSQSEISRKQQVLEKNLTDLDTRKQRLSLEDKDLAKNRIEIEDTSSSLLRREREIANLEKDLLEREANAEAGFILERKSSLALLKHSYTELQQPISAMLI
jgi:chromosome segregation ATPase